MADIDLMMALLNREVIYKNGKIVGEAKSVYKDGFLMKQEEYQAGQLNGTVREYFVGKYGKKSILKLTSKRGRQRFIIKIEK